MMRAFGIIAVYVTSTVVASTAVAVAVTAAINAVR
jgi:hypothetical protein